MANPTIYWHRRDLRLNDNRALSETLASGGSVLGLYVFDADYLARGDYGERRWAYISKCVKSLQQQYAESGGRLLVRSGEVVDELSRVAKEVSAGAVYCSKDYEPYERFRDFQADLDLKKLGVQVKSFSENYLCEPHAMVKDGAPITDFGDYAREWNQRISPDKDSSKVLELTNKNGLKLGEIAQNLSDLWPLEFESAWSKYEVDLSVIQSGSLLALGAMSPRNVLHTKQKEALESLARRDYYNHILAHFPRVELSAFQEEYAVVRWRGNPEHIQLWLEGRTGYPLVDAAMRQLREEGWIPEDLRFYAAAFLVKVLLLDWRLGENHFMRELIDGNLAQNNGLWQRAAGVGADAEPEFQAFNPDATAERLDPDGSYRARWPKERLAPIVDWEGQAQQAKEMFLEARSGLAAKLEIQRRVDAEVEQRYWGKGAE